MISGFNLFGMRKCGGSILSLELGVAKGSDLHVYGILIEDYVSLDFLCFRD